MTKNKKSNGSVLKRQLEELKSRHRKVTFHLGDTINSLHKTQDIRLLYTSDGVKEEGEVKKSLKLLAYLEDRISKYKKVNPKK